jgi:putative transcription antitermination factor YqgF
MRALGLDVGSKAIGVALTDEAGIAAHPLTVLDRVGNSGDAAKIAALATEHGVTDVVVGIPYELSGKRGHRAKRVDELVAARARRSAKPSRCTSKTSASRPPKRSAC